MSRAAEDDVAKQAEGQNKVFNTNAQTAFTGTQGSINAEQGDVGAYQDQRAKFAAANPFGKGGEFQTSVNQSTAGTADAASQAAAQAAQAAAVRTGQNAAGGVAAGQATNQANTRELMNVQAKANADRIGAGANYGKEVLGATAIPATLQGAITGEDERLAGTEGSEGNTALEIEQRADGMPNFGDTLGTAFAQALGTTAGGGNGVGSTFAGKVPGCWIAAELYGGWFDPRTQDVRRWIFGEFSKTPWGFIICAVYTWCGERVAGWIRRWPLLRRVFLPIFNAVLAKSREVNRGQ